MMMTWGWFVGFTTSTVSANHEKLAVGHPEFLYQGKM
jgi:hypothetical protein